MKELSLRLIKLLQGLKEFTRQMCHETRSRDVASRACFYLFWFFPFLLILYLRARRNLQYCTDHIVGYIIVVVLYLQPQFLSHYELSSVYRFQQVMGPAHCA